MLVSTSIYCMTLDTKLCLQDLKAVSIFIYN